MISADGFEGWLMFMEDAIQQFMDELPTDVARRLDFTPASLTTLESWLIDAYPSPTAILRPSENWYLDRTARYVGETIRRAAGGDWTINLTDPEQAFYGLPTVRKIASWTECPASMVTASLDRRSGNYLSSIIKNLTLRS